MDLAEHQLLQLKRAARIVSHGGVIAYPTEAVFGLGCDPFNEAAVRRLLAIKRRSLAKGLILIAAALEQVQPLFGALNALQRDRLQATWPGPLTWLVPGHRKVPAWLRGRHRTLAVRVTAHPVAAALCRLWGRPLVSTSANISGHPPARSALAVRRQLGQQVDYVVTGPTGGANRPSEIRDLASGCVLRAG